MDNQEHIQDTRKKELEDRIAKVKTDINNRRLESMIKRKEDLQKQIDDIKKELG